MMFEQRLLDTECYEVKLVLRLSCVHYIQGEIVKLLIE